MAGPRRAAPFPDDDPIPAETFRERVLTGEYPALHEPGIAETLARAASPHGLAAEIGALRVALARLLEEEPDPSRFAAGVARLVAVAVQAANAQRAAGAAVVERFDGVTERLTSEGARHGADDGAAGAGGPRAGHGLRGGDPADGGIDGG